MATRLPLSDQDSTRAEPRPHEISSKVMMGAAESGSNQLDHDGPVYQHQDQSAAVAPVSVKDKAPSETILAESDQTMQAAGTA